jgi:hypothetical protein
VTTRGRCDNEAPAVGRRDNTDRVIYLQISALRVARTVRMAFSGEEQHYER